MTMRSLLRQIAGLLLLTLTVPALAADPAGFWTLRADGKTLMTFEVRQAAGHWSGVWTQPATYSTDGDLFSDIADHPQQRTTREAHAVPGGIELVFDSAWPGGRPDHVVLRIATPASAIMSWSAFKNTPYVLSRMDRPVPLGPWEKDRGYLADTDRPTSAAMTALFDADQAARAEPAKVDWKAVIPADAARRARTQALLDAGQLSSGEDFYHAAYVFQHGAAPDDYLKAHALAVVAIARGRADATWIAAATLDRYLQSIDRRQIYGTQFTRPEAAFTQEPYDRHLLSDAVRRASHVPPLADQEQQRRDWDRRIPVKTVRP